MAKVMGLIFSNFHGGYFDCRGFSYCFMMAGNKVSSFSDDNQYTVTGVCGAIVLMWYEWS